MNETPAEYWERQCLQWKDVADKWRDRAFDKMRGEGIASILALIGWTLAFALLIALIASRQ